MVRNQRDSEKLSNKEELEQIILRHQEDLITQQNKSNQKQEMIIEELRQIKSEQFKVQKQLGELKQIHLQQQLQKQKQDTELEKTLQNQAKQQGLLLNLVLDLRNTKSSEGQASAEPVKTESDNKCVICLDKPLTIAVRPCGHMISCLECVKKLSPKCPICRSTISDTLKIYFP